MGKGFDKARVEDCLLRVKYDLERAIALTPTSKLKNTMIDSHVLNDLALDILHDLKDNVIYG